VNFVSSISFLIIAAFIKLHVVSNAGNNGVEKLEHFWQGWVCVIAVYFGFLVLPFNSHMKVRPSTNSVPIHFSADFSPLAFRLHTLIQLRNNSQHTSSQH
jgi:hypothetical protein